MAQSTTAEQRAFRAERLLEIRKPLIERGRLVPRLQASIQSCTAEMGALHALLRSYRETELHLREDVQCEKRHVANMEGLLKLRDSCIVRMEIEMVALRTDVKMKAELLREECEKGLNARMQFEKLVGELSEALEKKKIMLVEARSLGEKKMADAVVLARREAQKKEREAVQIVARERDTSMAKAKELDDSLEKRKLELAKIAKAHVTSLRRVKELEALLEQPVGEKDGMGVKGKDRQDEYAKRKEQLAKDQEALATEMGDMNAKRREMTEEWDALRKRAEEAESSLAEANARAEKAESDAAGTAREMKKLRGEVRRLEEVVASDVLPQMPLTPSTPVNVTVRKPPVGLPSPSGGFLISPAPLAGQKPPRPPADMASESRSRFTNTLPFDFEESGVDETEADKHGEGKHNLLALPPKGNSLRTKTKLVSLPLSKFGDRFAALKRKPDGKDPASKRTTGQSSGKAVTVDVISPAQPSEFEGDVQYEVGPKKRRRRDDPSAEGAEAPSTPGRSKRDAASGAATESPVANSAVAESNSRKLRSGRIVYDSPGGNSLAGETTERSRDHDKRLPKTTKEGERSGTDTPTRRLRSGRVVVTEQSAVDSAATVTASATASRKNEAGKSKRTESQITNGTETGSRRLRSGRSVGETSDPVASPATESVSRRLRSKTGAGETPKKEDSTVTKTGESKRRKEARKVEMQVAGGREKCEGEGEAPKRVLRNRRPVSYDYNRKGMDVKIVDPNIQIDENECWPRSLSLRSRTAKAKEPPVRAQLNFDDDSMASDPRAKKKRRAGVTEDKRLRKRLRR